MRTDDGRIDHLQRGVRHSASREPFQDHVPDATVGPPPKLPKDRVPVAEALRQVAPRCAGSHQPKHRVEHAAMIAWRPAAAAMDQERFEVRPLIVGHQSANQGCPPQRAALNQFAILASIGLSTRPKSVVNGLDVDASFKLNAGKISFSSKGVSIDGANVSVSGSVNYNPNGEHIAAVEVFLLRNLGYQSDELNKAAAIIYERDKDNPFFEYLANGRTPRMLQLILNKCPSLDQPSVSRFQWFPERGEELQKDRNKTAWAERIRSFVHQQRCARVFGHTSSIAFQKPSAHQR